MILICFILIMCVASPLYYLIFLDSLVVLASVSGHFMGPYHVSPTRFRCLVDLLPRITLPCTELGDSSKTLNLRPISPYFSVCFVSMQKEYSGIFGWVLLLSIAGPITI